jgi:small subunit ribosomal protein S16
VAVKIRMKMMGRKHRPFFRICAMDARRPRGGRVLEELGTYDPLVPDTDARVLLNGERVNYWLGVGAQPTEKVKVLIKKYGAEGTHLAQQQAALGARCSRRRRAHRCRKSSPGRRSGRCTGARSSRSCRRRSAA